MTATYTANVRMTFEAERDITAYARAERVLKAVTDLVPEVTTAIIESPQAGVHVLLTEYESTMVIEALRAFVGDGTFLTDHRLLSDRIASEVPVIAGD